MKIEKPLAPPAGAAAVPSIVISSSVEMSSSLMRDSASSFLDAVFEIRAVGSLRACLEELLGGAAARAATGTADEQLSHQSQPRVAKRGSPQEVDQ